MYILRKTDEVEGCTIERYIMRSEEMDDKKTVEWLVPKSERHSAVRVSINARSERAKGDRYGVFFAFICPGSNQITTGPQGRLLITTYKIHNASSPKLACFLYPNESISRTVMNLYKNAISRHNKLQTTIMFLHFREHPNAQMAQWSPHLQIIPMTDFKTSVFILPTAVTTSKLYDAQA